MLVTFRGLSLAGLLLASMPLVVDARPAAADASPPPIVFVVFDELATVSLLDEQGAIDAELFPAFAELASTSTWARGHSTVATRMLESLPALLTGRMPSAEKRKPIRAHFPENVFSWLENDYVLVVREHQSVMGPTSMSAEQQEEWLTRVRRDSYRGPKQPHVYGSFLSSIRSVEQAAKGASEPPNPGFYFVHLTLPYGPWRYSAEGTRYEPHRMEGYVGGRWRGSEDQIDDAWRRHLNEARLADVMLARLMAELKTAGIFERSLLIVTSSYGVGFWPGESRRVPSETEHPEDVLMVPLFVKAPGQEAGVLSLDVVQSIDVVPTIADVLGRAPPWPMDGCSLLDDTCVRPAERVTMRLDGSAESRGIDAYPADLHARRATLERRWKRFPDVVHLDRSWPAGRFEAWMGKSPAQAGLDAEAASAGSWTLDRRARAWRKGGRRALRFSGTIELEGEGPGADEVVWIAIALNDRIEAVVQAGEERRGRRKVRAMLPESRLQGARNTLALFVIDESGPGAPRLGPVAQSTEEVAPRRKAKAAE